MVGVVVEAAVITIAPAVADAVNTVATVLAVCAGTKVPQVAVGVQLQSTPALAVSFVTVAAMDAVPFTVSEAGGAVVIATVITGGGGTVFLLVLPQAEMDAARISTRTI